jgi:hypothetical protein
MMRSLITDPMSWWPLGIVIGGVLGTAVNRYEKRRAAPDPRDLSDAAVSATHPRRAAHVDPGRESS